MVVRRGACVHPSMATWMAGSIECINIVCLVFLCSTCCHGQTNPQLAVQGRFLSNNQSGGINMSQLVLSPSAQSTPIITVPQLISWTSSSLFATFEGASTVSLAFTASPDTNISYSINWLRFFVDGQVVGDGFTSYKTPALNTVIRVDKGKHTLRIAKLSDPTKGEVTLNSIQLDSGNFLPPEAPSAQSDRRILVLGDSYTVGYGDAGAVIPNTCEPIFANIPPDLRSLCQNQQIPDDECASFIQIMNGNSLAAFGAITADAFTADFQVLATSGSGMVGFSYGLDVFPNYNLAQIQQVLPSNAMLFNRTFFSSPNPPYQFQSWIPQVVVVASGTNDWHLTPPEFSLPDWLSQAVAFLQTISDIYNKPTIIIQAWSAETQNANSGSSGSGVVQVGDYLLAMPALVRQARQAGLNNVMLLNLNATSYDDTNSWCDGHPSAAAHKAVARQLVATIQQNFPKWTIDNPVNLTVDQQGIRPNLSLLRGGNPVQG